MKKLKDILLWSLGAACLLGPFFYWICHPELTQMQMLLNFWYLYAIGAGILIGMMVTPKKR